MPYVGQSILYRLPSFEETVQRVGVGAGEPAQTTLDRIAREYADGKFKAEKLEQTLEALFAEETRLDRVVHEDKPNDGWVVVLPGLVVATQESWTRQEELSYPDGTGQRVSIVPELSSSEHVHLVAFAHDRQHYEWNVPFAPDGDPQPPKTWRLNPHVS